ncbi:MAG: AAA family ATPase [Bacilli bacterium]|nr:AAA family ATPase [Bacilli bacterium]
MDLFEYIRQLIEEKGSVVIAIDGMAGAGKSTFAKKISAIADSRIISTDDFHLPEEMRTDKRYRIPGGNVHHERMKEEVISHVREEISYGVYDCKTDSINKIRDLPAKPLTIIEGTYSMHPEFGDYYDLSFFLECDPKEQIRRLAKRDLKKLQDFKDKWIPMETLYFKKTKVKDKADCQIG